MELLTQVLVVLVPTVVGLIFGWLKKKSSDHSKALEALEAGVLAAWEEVGREKKTLAKKEDGQAKLSNPQRKELRDFAKEVATNVMIKNGLQLEKIIKTPEEQDLAIKTILNKIKS